MSSTARSTMGDEIHLSGDFRGAKLTIEGGNETEVILGWSAFENQIKPHIGSPILVNRKLSTGAVVKYEAEQEGVTHIADEDLNLESVTFTGSKPLKEHLTRVGTHYLELKEEAKKK